RLTARSAPRPLRAVPELGLCWPRWRTGIDRSRPSARTRTAGAQAACRGGSDRPTGVRSSSLWRKPLRVAQQLAEVARVEALLDARRRTDPHPPQPDEARGGRLLELVAFAVGR